MASILIRSLITSPIYGFAALVVTLLPWLVLGAIIGLIAGASVDPLDLDSMVRALQPGIAGAIILVLLQVLISLIIAVQQIRYAASFSGAMPIDDQPGFWRGVLIFFVVNIVLSLVLVAVIVGIAALDSSNLAGLAELLDQVDRAEQSGEVRAILGDPAFRRAGVAGIFAILVLNMLLVMVLVPALTGLGQVAGRAWTIGLLLYRFLLAVPLIVLMAWIMGYGVAGIVLFATDLPGGVLWLHLIAGLFALTVMHPAYCAHEAILLRATGRPVHVPASPQRAEVDLELAVEDFRALRKQRADGAAD